MDILNQATSFGVFEAQLGLRLGTKLKGSADQLEKVMRKAYPATHCGWREEETYSVNHASFFTLYRPTGPVSTESLTYLRVIHPLHGEPVIYTAKELVKNGWAFRKHMTLNDVHTALQRAIASSATFEPVPADPIDRIVEQAKSGMSLNTVDSNERQVIYEVKHSSSYAHYDNIRSNYLRKVPFWEWCVIRGEDLDKCALSWDDRARAEAYKNPLVQGIVINKARRTANSWPDQARLAMEESWQQLSEQALFQSPNNNYGTDTKEVSGQAPGLSERGIAASIQSPRGFTAVTIGPTRHGEAASLGEEPARVSKGSISFPLWEDH